MVVEDGVKHGPGGRALARTIAVLVGSVLLVLADQWTKALALQYLVPGQSVSVLNVPGLGDVCLLVLVWNTGAFLSLGAGLGGFMYVLLMIVVPFIALAAMLVYLWRPWWARKPVEIKDSLRLAIGFALAGGAGNLVDRVREGQVVDFLNFGVGPLRTGVMNVADLYILGALICLLVFYFRHYRVKAVS